METSLLVLIFHVAMTSLAQIVESSCEVGLETDVVGDAFAVESVVSDVEGCAIAMTRILRGIGIASLLRQMLLHI